MFSSNFFLRILSPPPPHKGSAVFQNIGLTRVFECQIFLKIEVIEYGKWASNWLEMHSQRNRGGGTLSFFLHM